MKNVLTKLAFAAAALAGASTSANAYVVLSLVDTAIPGSVKSCDTSQAFTLTNCGAGFIGGGNVAITPGMNSIKYSGSVGGFTVDTTSLNSNTPGTPLEGFLDESSTSAERKAGVGSGTLFVSVTAFDYAFPAGEYRTMTGSTGFSSSKFNPNDTVTTILSVDPANLGGGLFDAGTFNFGCTMDVPLVYGPSISPSCSFGNQLWDSTNPLFSMRSAQTYFLAEGSRINSTANSSVHPIPEPVSTALIGIGLFGLAVSSRRRVAKKA